MRVKMIGFISIFLINIFFLIVHATCPNWSHKKKNFDVLEKWNNLLLLHQFKSVSTKVQSPFNITEKPKRYTQIKLRNLEMSEECYQETRKKQEKFKKYNYNEVNFKDFNVTTRKFKIKYNANNSLFCHAKYKIEEVYLLDFQVNKFISFYGCEIFDIDGNLTKVEGVLIFKTYINIYLNINSTYKMLEEQANISRSSLLVFVQSEGRPGVETCDDLLKTSLNCTKNLVKSENRFQIAIIFGLSCVFIWFTVVFGLKCWIGKIKK